MTRLVGFLRDRRGDLYVDFLVKFLIAIAVVVTLISFFDMFIKHQNLVFVANRLVRAVEVSGLNDSTLDSMVVQLCTELGLENAEFDLELDVCPIHDGTCNCYALSNSAAIQLRHTFTVVVRYSMVFTIAQPGEANIGIPFTMQVRLPGMSEVYFR